MYIVAYHLFIASPCIILSNVESFQSYALLPFNTHVQLWKPKISINFNCVNEFHLPCCYLSKFRQHVGWQQGIKQRLIYIFMFIFANHGFTSFNTSGHGLLFHFIHSVDTWQGSHEVEWPNKCCSHVLVTRVIVCNRGVWWRWSHVVAIKETKHN